MKYSPGGRYFKYRPPLGLSWPLDRTWTATYRLRISEISNNPFIHPRSTAVFLLDVALSSKPRVAQRARVQRLQESLPIPIIATCESFIGTGCLPRRTRWNGMARWCHGRRGSWRSEYCGEPASGDGESLHKHDTMRLLVGFDHYIDLDTMTLCYRSSAAGQRAQLPHGTEVRQSVY